MYGDYVRNIFGSTRMQTKGAQNHSPHNFFELFHHHPKSLFLGPTLSLICRMTNPKIGWVKWLDEHDTSTTYDAHPDKVAKICSAASALENFESLCKCKNLVLLNRAPMGKKDQATFLHSTVGLSILPDELHYVARIGTTL